MDILVINAGSSSLKYQVINMQDKQVVAKGIVEKIGMDGSFLEYDGPEKDEKITTAIANHTDALKLIVDNALTPEVLASIKAVGHRVVHGGEYFQDAVIVDEDVLSKITACCDLAPLHNPANLQGIIACQKTFPLLPQVTVFDTAFYQSMEAKNYIYPIPYSFYQEHKIRRYGFHGTSHKYVYNRFLEITPDSNKLKVITCHVGNGGSISAIDGGRVVETSMGFTPLEGLVMGTRSGIIDPAIVTYMVKNLNLPADEVDNILNKKSGLLGVSGVSSDMRDIISGIESGDTRCQLALDIYINSIVKYIGSYASLMNGVDAIVLTAGVMERSKIIRDILIKRLSRLGITLDTDANENGKGERLISTAGSKVKVMVIPTNEELEIANETLKLVS